MWTSSLGFAARDPFSPLAITDLDGFGRQVVGQVGHGYMVAIGQHRDRPGRVRFVGAGAVLLRGRLARAAELVREVLQLRQPVAHRQHGLGIVDVTAGAKVSVGNVAANTSTTPGAGAGPSGGRRKSCSMALAELGLL